MDVDGQDGLDRAPVGPTHRMRVDDRRNNPNFFFYDRIPKHSGYVNIRHAWVYTRLDVVGQRGPKSVCLPLDSKARAIHTISAQIWVKSRSTWLRRKSSPGDPTSMPEGSSG